MTREETIHELGEWLEQMIKHGVPGHSAKRKALATAIALLSTDRPTDGDIISRADAIEALCHNCAYYTDAQCKTDSGYWCESGAMIREDIPSADRPTESTNTPTVFIDGIGHFPKLSSADRPTGSWISEIDTGTWMLKCSVCGCRVQEEKYRVAVGEAATKCPYCGAELGQGGYLYDEYADRPSQRGDGDEA